MLAPRLYLRSHISAARLFRMASSAANVAPIESNGPPRKRAWDGANKNFQGNKKQRKLKKSKAAQEGSHDEILTTDVRNLLSKLAIARQDETEGANTKPQTLPEQWSEVELTISEISSTGDGLGTLPDSKHVFVVPFTTPGDKVLAKVVRHEFLNSYTVTDFVKVLEPGQDRDDSLIKCPYFSSCSGCQLQMLPYDVQLAHKRRIVEKAYANFSNLPPEDVPTVGDTMGSPLQYGYRTKLTPHFDGPPNARRDQRNGVQPKWDKVPPIGFMKKNTRRTLDIEDCPIGTDAVRNGVKSERERVTKELEKYRKGATLLLRENTKRISKEEWEKMSSEEKEKKQQEDKTLAVEDRGQYVHLKTCTTEPNATTTEYVDDWIFTNPASAFFQNNNSILPPFTQYIRDHILPSSSSPGSPKITHLIDAYSGSGLFTITLSPLFKSSQGIDVAVSSIQFATKNAELNKLSPSQTSFVAADANALFASISAPPDETAVVLDPPRKGCDMNFLNQLLEYGPQRVIYVSCNVHTQARDVGILVRGTEGKKTRYVIESLRGFDFFPQTGHVEGVAVLRRREATEETSNESAPEAKE